MSSNQYLKFSIIIPSFNQGEYIEKTLLSILTQKYEGLIEIIVIDGGSTDGTIEVLKKYNEYISYWISEKDNGFADALNKGFLKISGEIVSILNSDDFYLPDVFSLVNKYFINFKNAVLVTGRSIQANPDLKLIDISYKSTTIWTLDRLFSNGPPPQDATFFDANILKKIDPLPSKIDYIVDYYLWFNILSFGYGISTNKFHAIYSVHGSQRTQANINKFASQLQMLPEVLRGLDYFPTYLKASPFLEYFCFREEGWCLKSLGDKQLAINRTKQFFSETGFSFEDCPFLIVDYSNIFSSNIKWTTRKQYFYRYSFSFCQRIYRRFLNPSRAIAKNKIKEFKSAILTFEE